MILINPIIDIKIKIMNLISSSIICEKEIIGGDNNYLITKIK